jgi:hypothetical protein
MKMKSYLTFPRTVATDFYCITRTHPVSSASKLQQRKFRWQYKSQEMTIQWKFYDIIKIGLLNNDDDGECEL